VKLTRDHPLRLEILAAQRNEITEYHIYSRLARSMGEESPNGKVLAQIAEDELAHYHFWRDYTGEDVAPDRWRAWKYYWIARILGLTFGIKLMERGEGQAHVTYERIAEEIPEAKRVAEDEDRHEHELLEMLDEERLQYVGSMVLGLNDALVELTGALAGLTFALQHTRLVALAGLITGIAASLAMASSEYLSTKSDEGEGEGRSPIKSALYTGGAYIVTVALLIAPYLLFADYFVCLGLTLAMAVLIILVFNYYIAVARDLDFRRRFVEMASISMGVAALSFGIGYLIRAWLGVDI